MQAETSHALSTLSGGWQKSHIFNGSSVFVVKLFTDSFPLSSLAVRPLVFQWSELTYHGMITYLVELHSIVYNLTQCVTVDLLRSPCEQPRNLSIHCQCSWRCHKAKYDWMWCSKNQKCDHQMGLPILRIKGLCKEKFSSHYICSFWHMIRSI